MNVCLFGSSGLDGQAFQSKWQVVGEVLLATPAHPELDLISQAAVIEFLESIQPAQVILAAANVGGIQANSLFPAEFIFENLMIELMSFIRPGRTG